VLCGFEMWVLYTTISSESARLWDVGESCCNRTQCIDLQLSFTSNQWDYGIKAAKSVVLVYLCLEVREMKNNAVHSNWEKSILWVCGILARRGSD